MDIFIGVRIVSRKITQLFLDTGPTLLFRYTTGVLRLGGFTLTALTARGEYLTNLIFNEFKVFSGITGGAGKFLNYGRARV